MSQPTVSHYRIFCYDEGLPGDSGAWVDGYGITPPVACYHNVNHNVNPDSVQQLEDYNPNFVIIQQEPLERTGGRFASIGVHFNASGSDITDYDYTFPHPISLINMKMQSNQSNVGDTVDLSYSPNAIPQGLSQSAVTGSDTLSVTPAVIQNIFVGAFVSINDNTNNNDLGRIVSIDTVGNTIKMENALTNNFDTNATLTTTQYIVKDFFINAASVHAIGTSVYQSQYIRANTTLRISYHNNGSDNKDFGASLEIFY